MRAVDLTIGVDRSRLFTCPTLTPLFYSAAFDELSDPQRLRYNQLMGLMQNEIIGFIESEFAPRALPVAMGLRGLPGDLAESLKWFWDDELTHTEVFRGINRAAEPGWYADKHYHILRPTRVMFAGVRFAVTRPSLFLMVFWFMLFMEERALMTSRRYAKLDPQTIDPLFSAAYKAHVQDEARHVQFDKQMILWLYERQSPAIRRLNATALKWIIKHNYITPRNGVARLVDLLITEFPDLADKRARLIGAVEEPTRHAGYQETIFSRKTMPTAFGLIDKLPEFQGLSEGLFPEPAR